MNTAFWGPGNAKIWKPSFRLKSIRNAVSAGNLWLLWARWVTLNNNNNGGLLSYVCGVDSTEFINCPPAKWRYCMLPHYHDQQRLINYNHHIINPLLICFCVVFFCGGSVQSYFTNYWPGIHTTAFSLVESIFFLNTQEILFRFKHCHLNVA